MAFGRLPKGSLASRGALVTACAVLLLANAKDASLHLLPGGDARIAADEANWVTTGRTYDEQRFSPLSQINDSNASQLGLAWYADLDMSRGEEATPLVVNGVLYVSTAWSLVKAFDATNGKLLWTFDPAVPRSQLVNACCDAVNRGVAWWRGRLYVGTLDGRLIAIDARTGKQAWSVQTTPKDMPYSITGAPRVIKGRVIIGNGGAELGARGFVTAYDAVSGRKVWRFYVVPGEPGKADGEVSDPQMAAARATWSGDAWWKQKAGGGNAWDAFAYDPELDLLYIGTGNGSPWNRMARSEGKGDNLYLSSILAVRPETGQYVWHYQEVPGDEWDYTATQSIVLADLVIAGKKRKVLMHAPKNGFFYVLDRETGKVISAEKYVPANWASKIDLATGRPVENPEARYSERGKPFYGTPSSLGGHNWPPMAFSPQTGLVYIPTQELALPYVPDPQYRKSALGYNTGNRLGAAVPQLTSPLKEAKGYLMAWDPIHQREVWRAPRDTFGNGGVLATAGNLVFEGTGTGFFKAVRASDGKELFSTWGQTGILAAPMTYTVRGKQYVAVLAGCGGVYGSACNLVDKDGRHANLDRVLVYALGGRARLPDAPAAQPMVLDPPAGTANTATIALGDDLYGRRCAVCHGYRAVSTGNQPDLRYSPFIADPDAWRSVVLDGILAGGGMVSFAKVLDHDQTEAIRQYLIAKAQEKRKQMQDGQDGKGQKGAEEPVMHAS
ncbi:PQQ-dependent dehydrogenase (methanol/ethanol family) [Novosphingobium capsulatum]|uniref:PQQ-dependent dehydrogenase (Methanol/ethanol family) n=1 Tax=Novosphingobium capsulatum TaxID=13688 RepID=A0ABU1MMK5_9SPHN|nr:PQQ-dependent dehydrogenase, methanol/ethanol family [Novosphingobium capsulatum]MDR6511580.1 PQQ-dependent dehydrogenase (methanol/ethanol family) [Novosphingobium capsulatum]